MVGGVNSACCLNREGLVKLFTEHRLFVGNKVVQILSRAVLHQGVWSRCALLISIWQRVLLTRLFVPMLQMPRRRSRSRSAGSRSLRSSRSRTRSRSPLEKRRGRFPFEEGPPRLEACLKRTSQATTSQSAAAEILVEERMESSQADIEAKSPWQVQLERQELMMAQMQLQLQALRDAQAGSTAVSAPLVSPSSGKSTAWIEAPVHLPPSLSADPVASHRQVGIRFRGQYRTHVQRRMGSLKCRRVEVLQTV